MGIALRSPFRAIQIVVTPGSGNGGALRVSRELRRVLDARGHRVGLRLFPDLERLRDWAAADTTRFSLLICVGGDGTQDTAAAAAVRRSIPFLAVCSGFGNLFGRALGQPDGVEDAVDLVERGELVDLDVGVRNGRLFLCHESFGLLSDIQRSVEARAAAAPRARWRRYFGYYQGALRQLRDAPLTPLRVAVDGQVIAGDAVIVTVANVEAYGPWLPLTPRASPVDGLLDVFAMRAASKRAILTSLLRRQLRLPGTDARALRCRGERITVNGPRVREALHVEPGRLPVLVSTTTAERFARDLARVGGVVPGSGRRVA